MHISFRKQPTVVRSNAKHPLGTVPHGVLVACHEFRYRLQRRFIIGMPEPMRLPQRCIGFDGSPTKLTMAVDHIPVFILDLARLVASPSSITVLEEARIREDNCVWLIGAERLHVFVEVIDVTGAS